MLGAGGFLGAPGRPARCLIVVEGAVFGTLVAVGFGVGERAAGVVVDFDLDLVPGSDADPQRARAAHRALCWRDRMYVSLRGRRRPAAQP